MSCIVKDNVKRYILTFFICLGLCCGLLTPLVKSSVENDCVEGNVGTSVENDCVEGNVGTPVENDCVEGNVGTPVENDCVEGNVGTPVENDRVEGNVGTPVENDCVEDNVGTPVENESVEDNVGTSGLENTGEENAEDEHSDNEASDGRLRHQNPSQETSKESENSKDGERFKDERNDPLICMYLDVVVVNNVGNSTCSSEQMEPSTLVQAKSNAQESLLVLSLENSSGNKREKMRKNLEQFFINKQRLAKKSEILDLLYNSTYNTRVFVYALPFSIGVILVPYEARYEHFRLSTFGHGRDLNLVQGVVMQLAREGFFCDITGSVVCFSCTHVITPNNLNHGLQHLRGILQNHICLMQGNVPIGEYGIECAQLLGSASAITPSGQPYQGHGVVQQNRLQPGAPYNRIVTSLTSFDQQNRLSHVNLASQGNAEQGYIDRSLNEDGD